MKWLRQIVIRAGSQPGDDAIFFGFRGKDDDVRIRTRGPGAYVFADLDSGAVGHYPIHDYESRSVLGEELHCFLARFREDQPILRGKRDFHEFPENA